MLVIYLNDMGFSQYTPYKIAENDGLRSIYIRQLLKEFHAHENSIEKTEIPKVLIQYWHYLK